VDARYSFGAEQVTSVPTTDVSKYKKRLDDF
jgi:hypothetical protein